MKKIFLGLIACMLAATCAFAASNEQIISFFKKIPDLANAKISIAKRSKIKGSDFEAVVVKISTDKYNNMDEIIFVNKNLLTTELINLNTMQSYNSEFRQKQQLAAQKVFDEKALKLLKNETWVISLGDSKKPLIYVFSDPQCPYCRKFLANVNEELKTNSLKYIITSVHGESGYKRTAQLYKAIKAAKTDEQKIAILNNYYSDNPKDPVSVSDDQINAAKNLFEKYNHIGLNAVPTLIKAR